MAFVCDTSINPQNRDSVSATTPSWFNCAVRFIFGNGATVDNPAPGQIMRNGIKATTVKKFQITPLSSFWSGKRISIDQHLYKSEGENLTFQGTKDEAEELLNTLGQLKNKGMLILIPTKEGRVTFQYRNFWITPSAEKLKRANEYIDALMTAHLTPKQKKHYSEHQQQFKSILRSYFLPPKTTLCSYFWPEKNPTRIHSLSSFISTPLDTHLAQYNTEKAIQEQRIAYLEPNTTPIEYLQNKQNIFVKTDTIIGKGACGTVYDTRSENPQQQYVYKEVPYMQLSEKTIAKGNFRESDIEQSAENLLEHSELKRKLWRGGDIAASRIKDIAPYFARSIGFFLEITCENKKTCCYVPTDAIKDFGKTLPEGTTKVVLRGQLIEKAPGKDLNELLNQEDFKIEDHFNGIAKSLFAFLKITHARNFIHRDLKPANFVYDPAQKTGMVVDAGLGRVFRPSTKPTSGDTKTKEVNPSCSAEYYIGTTGFQAPSVLAGTPYGSEVDFYSSAVMLLAVLANKDFAQVMKDRDNKNHLINTKKFIEYFNERNPGNLLSQTLQKYPSTKTIIDLFFGVASANPEERATAFQQLEEYMKNVDSTKHLESTSDVTSDMSY